MLQDITLSKILVAFIPVAFWIPWLELIRGWLVTLGGFVGHFLSYHFACIADRKLAQQAA
jgi:uncharacterized membrane protein